MSYRPDVPAPAYAERLYNEQVSWTELMTVRRLRLGWTKEVLADRCGVTRMTLWRLEMGMTEPTRVTRKKINDALLKGETEQATQLVGART